MNKANEYKKIADESSERYGKWKKRQVEQSKNESWLGKIQYKYILWKVKKTFSKGKISINFFGNYLYSFHSDFLTSLYVINKLQDDGFEVYYDSTKNPKKYLLKAIIVS